MVWNINRIWYNISISAKDISKGNYNFFICLKIEKITSWKKNLLDNDDWHEDYCNIPVFFISNKQLVKNENILTELKSFILLNYKKKIEFTLFNAKLCTWVFLNSYFIHVLQMKCGVKTLRRIESLLKRKRKETHFRLLNGRVHL